MNSDCSDSEMPMLETIDLAMHEVPAQVVRTVNSVPSARVCLKRSMPAEDRSHMQDTIKRMRSMNSELAKDAGPSVSEPLQKGALVERRERRVQLVAQEGVAFSLDSEFRKGVMLNDLGMVQLRPLCLELFGGCARLTKCLCVAGFDGVAIDWVRNQSVPEGPSVKLNLADPASLKLVLQLLRSGRVVYIHMGPPCGTASRAREIPIPGSKSAPRPLRSAAFPDGLSGLTPVEQLRIEQSNLLYAAVEQVVVVCVKLGILFSVENPTNSWFWSTSFMKRLEGLGLLETVFHVCMHGGRRDKSTKLLHNIPLFAQLQVSCDKSHAHAPWGTTKLRGRTVFNTASEAQYPLVLCQRMAVLVVQQLDLKLVPQKLIAPVQSSLLSERKTAAGRQPRGSKAVKLVPEYQEVKKFVVELAECTPLIDNYKLKTPIMLKDGCIPAGAKVLRSQQSVGDGRAGFFRDVYCGIPWDAEAFIEAAKRVQHPVDSFSILSPKCLNNLFMTLTKGSEWMESSRSSSLQHYERLAGTLLGQERQLHESLPEEFKPVLLRKKILIFKRMLQDTGFPDTGLVDRLVSGFALTGKLEDTGHFEKVAPKNKNPLSVQDLMKTSRWARKSLIARVGPGLDPESDALMWTTALEERDAGWLQGPFEEADMDKRHGALWLAARRFVIVQSGKYRQIDDYSEHGHNSTVWTDERIPMGGVDEILVLAKMMAGAVDGDRKVKLGGVQGKLHSSWTLEEARSLVGKVFDLKAAYKQLVRRRADAPFATISLWDLVGCRVVFFDSVVLPFGSTGSVFGFNRVSAAIKHLLEHIAMVNASAFFDDYTVLEYAKMQESADRAVMSLLRLIGWDVSVDKLSPFSGSFKALGVFFELQLLRDGGIRVSNTEARKEAVRDEIDKILESGSLSQTEASALRGRLVFTEAQHWSRCGAATATALSERANQRSGFDVITPELRSALLFAKWLVCHAPAREFYPLASKKVHLFFTDGSADGTVLQKVGVGGLYLPPDGGRPEYFSEQVPADLVAMWQSAGSRQCIMQGELLPVVIAKRLWGPRTHSARCLTFVDNDSARESLVRGTSSNSYSKGLLLHSVIEDAKSGALHWYSRVSSEGNPSDEPSRMNSSLMEKLGALRVRVELWAFKMLASEDVVAALSELPKPTLRVG